jgi:hypothetical protein
MWSLIMMSRSLVLPSLLLALVVSSCGKANFFGGGSSKRSDNPSGQNPNGQNPNGQNPNGQNPNGQNPNGQNPTAQNPQTGPGSQITQPNPNTVVFGKDKVFHIGDGRFQNTSCKDEVSQLPLNGTVYYFDFQVLNDNTLVNIDVGRVCGVDYTSNSFSIIGSVPVQQKSVPLSTTNLKADQANLMRGNYRIYLASGWGRDGDSAPDLDDFIVGQVTVRGNKEVRPLSYGAFNR